MAVIPFDSAQGIAPSSRRLSVAEAPPPTFSLNAAKPAKHG
ncbi:MAG: hypothetical protein AAGN15_17375 [Cyanobacteria bacterium J06581_3]